MLGFEPYSLDLGPKGDEALRMELGGMDGRTDVCRDGRTYRRTDSLCVLQDFVPFGAAAQKQRERKKERRKE